MTLLKLVSQMTIWNFLMQLSADGLPAGTAIPPPRHTVEKIAVPAGRPPYFGAMIQVSFWVHPQVRLWVVESLGVYPERHVVLVENLDAYPDQHVDSTTTEL